MRGTRVELPYMAGTFPRLAVFPLAVMLLASSSLLAEDDSREPVHLVVIDTDASRPLWFPWRADEGRAISPRSPSVECRLFRYARGLTDEGRRAARRDTARMIDVWHTRLDAGDRTVAWLLEPAFESRGGSLRAASRGLEICVHRATPDLRQRLAHPALHVDEFWPESAPFQAGSASNRLVSLAGDFWKSRKSGMSGRSIEILSAGELAPESWVRLGEAEVARLPFLLTMTDPVNLQIRRAAVADRRYFLRLEAGHRWLADPLFRQWLRHHIDRESLATRLLAGHGRVDRLDDASPRRASQPPTRRPFSTDSRPRLRMAHDSADPLARAIAASLVKRLATSGIRLELQEGDGTESRVAMTLDWRPVLDNDPVLRWVDVIDRDDASPGVEGLLNRLQVASRARGVDARGQALQSLHAALEPRVLPLIVTHGHCLTRAGITVGVECGATQRSLQALKIDPR
ncbi:MAG: hypothetical protein OES25_13110 [Acidobacteriota bacterium]|nr:hypothetical protein [Acidobacteriota bacterium]